MPFFAAYLLAPMTWISFVFGAFIGSFLNVCIYRIPEGTFWKHARSVCRSCGARIPFYLNIPILSWFFLRGRTRCCDARLPVQYPLVELFTAVCFSVIYWKFPFVSMHGQTLGFNDTELLLCAHALILACLLIICSVIDLRLMIIPDVISLPMIAATPLVVLLHPTLDWQSALLGVLAGGLSLYAIAWIYWMIRREPGIGPGDIKLLAAIGGWIGYQAVFPTIFYGSVLGSIVGLLVMLIGRRLHMRSQIPFGPFLATGAMMHLLFGGWIAERLLPLA